MPSPPKPKETPDELAEVERALSVLQGRHPEHERVRREGEEARRKRQEQIDAAARVAERAALKRRLVTGAIVAGVLVVGVAGGVVFRGEIARRGRVEQLTDPFRAMGFVVLQTGSRGAPGKLEANAEAGCLLAASTAETPMRVERAGGAVEGPGPVLWCTCEPERVAVSADVGEEGGVALLRVDAASIGGSMAFPFLPFKPATTARGDEACALGSLDAWIAAKHAPKPAPDPAWLKAEPAREVLGRVGFEVAATLERATPFAVLDVPEQRCLLATSARAEDKLSLRLPSGPELVPPTAGAVGWCTSTAATAMIAREGEGAVNVLVAPAARVGGLEGLRELASAASVPLVATALASSDHAWDARQLLLASAVPEAVITTASGPSIAPDPEARVVALSFGTPNALTSESPDDVFSYCEPPLTDETRQAVCVFSGPQTWHLNTKDAKGGLARSKLPFWLFGLKDVSEPVALQVETRLVSLARRLRREGFEPTTLEAITELPDAVEILGRSNEDAVVAVSLAPAAPWAFPLTDGPAWTLEGEPRVLPIKPLETLKLRGAGKPLPPKAVRRTVVFRRQAR